MIKLRALVIVLSIMIWTSCSERKKPAIPNHSLDNIESYIKSAMEVFGVPGASVAIIKGNDVFYKNSFGTSSLEDSTKVTNNTIFRVFSTTKLTTTIGVFQLIEQGKLSLEDSLNTFLPNIPKEWNEIQIKHLLTHSSGLPDMIWFDNSLSDYDLLEKLKNAEIVFEVGEEFMYNQTNYWFLAQIIEHLEKSSFQKFILANQFPNSGNTVLFSSNSSESILNRSEKYNYDQQQKKMLKESRNDGKRALAGNGLNISLNQFIEWSMKLDSNKLVSLETKEKMWSPFSYQNGKRDFLMGWGKYNTNNSESVGFSGGNVSNFRKFVKDDVTIIFLSNGYKLNAYDIIVDDLARLSVQSIKKNNPTLEFDVFKLVEDREYDKGTKLFKKLVTENPATNFGNLKGNINRLGNWLLEEEKFEEAIKMYSVNAITFPDWWVSYVGIGEAFENLNELEKGVEQYNIALELNVNNEMRYNSALQEKIEELKNEIMLTRNKRH